MTQNPGRYVVPGQTVLVWEPFYNANLAQALDSAVSALKGKEGSFIPHLPWLADQRVKADNDDPLWSWLTPLSEDVSGHGEYKGAVGHWVVTLHGNGLLVNAKKGPERIQRALNVGLNKLYAADLSTVFDDGGKVFADLLRGGLPDGGEIRLFSYDELLAGAAEPYLRDNKPFGVVRTLTTARETTSGYQSIEGLEGDSQVIVYTGGKSRAEAYVPRSEAKFKTRMLAVRHPFNLDGFNPDTAQARVLQFGNYFSDGLGGIILANSGRFPGVVPEALVARRVTLDSAVHHALAEGRGFRHNGVLYAPVADNARVDLVE